MQTEAMQIFRLIFVNTALAGNLSGIIVLCKLNIYYFNNHPPLSLPFQLSISVVVFLSHLIFLLVSQLASAKLLTLLLCPNFPSFFLCYLILSFFNIAISTPISPWELEQFQHSKIKSSIRENKSNSINFDFICMYSTWTNNISTQLVKVEQSIFFLFFVCVCTAIVVIADSI